MKKTIHRAATRGYADHGWLQTHHTFSFAGYYDPTRVHFGALRVLNDDTVAPGEGFGTHPHDNMEIVSIVLSGALKHGDSMGHMKILEPGDIQVMSAGTGITHSEMNASREEPAKFLQIWVLTDADNHTPRYNQIELLPGKRNELRLIVGPESHGSEHVGWIHQKAWLSTLDLTEKLDAAVADLQPSLPADVRIATDIFRQQRFIDSSIDNIRKSLYEGGVFVVIVLFLFLMNVRSSRWSPSRCRCSCRS
jgi:redox-sensitive bicupin YhaK (pirin superfamily)